MRGELTVYDWCCNVIEKRCLSEEEGNDIVYRCILYANRDNDNKNLLSIAKLITKTYEITVDSTTIYNAFAKKDRLYSEEFTVTSLIYLEQLGYSATWKDVKPVIRDLLNQNRYGNNTGIIIDILMYAFKNDPNEFTKEKVKNISFLKGVATYSFTDTFLFAQRVKVYSVVLVHAYGKTAKLSDLKFICSQGVPYGCVRPIAKAAKLSSSDVVELIEVFRSRPMMTTDPDILIDYGKHIESNEDLCNECVNWLCKETKTIKYVRSFHKKTRHKFNQENLNNALIHPRENASLVQYILENSTREETKVTKVIFEKAMEKVNPPKIIGLLINFME